MRCGRVNSQVLVALSLCLSAYAEGPSIKIVEFDKEGTQLNTYEMKANPPKKDLVKMVDGRPALNTDSSNSQESGVRTLLDANFDFSRVCNYRERTEFGKKYPDKEDWEIDELFAGYIMSTHTKLRNREQCFAAELETLLKAHPCLQKQGTLTFYVMPDDDARMTYDIKPNDYRRVMGVGLTGCPYGNQDEMLTACTWKRNQANRADFLRPGDWASFVEKCSAEFKKPEIKQMADATMNRAHTR